MLETLAVTDAITDIHQARQLLKIDRSHPEINLYGQSYKFTLLSDEMNDLYRVARVLKRIGSAIA